MKMFNVTIDNEPGGWKSGSDQTILVLATNGDDAIKKVKNGWGFKFDHGTDTNPSTMILTEKGGYTPFFSYNAKFSVCEIQFEGFEIAIGLKEIRKKKLDKIVKAD